MATVYIRREGEGIVYDPPSIQLSANDFIVFVNLDPEAPHQPTQVGEVADYWFDDELPAFTEEPAASSPAINLAGNPGTSIEYEDGREPDSGITGTITF